MKTDSRHRLSTARKLRVFVRFLGLTAVPVLAVGTLLAATSWSPVPVDSLESVVGHVEQAINGGFGQLGQIATYLLLGGLSVLLIALVIELLAGLFSATKSRSAVGFNWTLQVALATAILVAVNVFSFQHYKRFDLTRNKQFTLPDSIVQELKKLRSETTIVVLQQHKTFGHLSNKPDGYDYAAERKVVEKVKDLVNLFRELGPQFRVVVLDVEEEGFDKKLEEETKEKIALKEAIKAAPENSIFFYADGRAQRLSFNEFYQLDKTASKEANDKKGNLVLLPQGIDTFTQRIVSIQEKRPKVALAVVHPWLTTEVSTGAQKEFTSAGLRKTLEEYGFDVVDVVLKKWQRGRPPEPTAYNRDENQLDRLEAQLAGVESRLRVNRLNRLKEEEAMKFFQETSLELLSRRFRRELGRDVTEEDRKLQVDLRNDALVRLDERYEELEKERRKLDGEVQTLLTKERLTEERRLNDPKAKFARVLADCDLLIVPRLTMMNATSEDENVSPEIHRLSPEQADVIKDFMKSGKPVLACLGPTNGPDGAPTDAIDDLERILADRGIELGRQTILFDGESESYALRQAGDILSGARADIPSVEFREPSSSKKPNPIAEAMRATSRNIDQKLDIQLRYLRPIYLAPGWSDRIPYAAEMIYTSADSWNEEKPFPEIRPIPGTRNAELVLPQYEAASVDDPKKGTRDEERRGPFSVGVAIEAPLPVEWYQPSFLQNKILAGFSHFFDHGLLSSALSVVAAQETRASSRLAVIGHGAVFSGVELTPGTEKLLLNTCNWLLKRDERLPQTNVTAWSYPRVPLDDQEKLLWRWGTFLGLPLLFAYLGIIVLMFRRMR